MDKKKKENKVIMPNFFAFGHDKVDLPIFKENTRKEWIEYGDNNLYPNFLVELMNNSSKHNSLLKKKVNLTSGDGWIETESNREFILNENGKEDLDTIVFKNSYDLMIYGGYCIAVTWSKDRQTIARISYVDFKSVRIAKELTDDSEIAKRQAKGVDFFYISADWGNPRKEKNKPELIQGFSEEFKDEATQLIYIKEYRPGTDFYTLPDYISSVDWISLDKEIANFHLSSVFNGFTPSMIISFKGGIPSDEEMNLFNKKIQKEYAGSDNASRVFLTFSENSETSPEFIPINLNASDSRFLQLEEQIQQNIVIAHGASPVVAGISVAGKLGTSSEIIESEIVFQKNVIDQKQSLIERTYNKLSKINGVDVEMELEGIKSFDDMVAPNEEEVTMENIVRKITEKTIEDAY